MAYFPNDNVVLDDLSSTGVINNGNNWTSSWVDVARYNTLSLAVSTDQNGYYTLQFSPDGTNADSTLTRYHRTDIIEPPHVFTIARRYARIVFYNNSGSNQTYFRFQTIAGQHNQLNIPVDSTMSPDYDAIATRPTDYHYEVALGRRQGHTTWNKFGYNSDIDVSSGEETIWAAGGTLSINSTGSFLTGVSSSAEDIAGGSGASAVIVYGVNSDWDFTTEVLNLSGTTGVQTANQYIGVNRVSVYGAGSSGSNVGNIQFDDGASNPQAYVPAGEGTTQQCFFFVPRNHQAFADWLMINSIKQTASIKPIVTLKMYVTSYVSNARYEVYRHTIDTEVENTITLNPEQPFVIGEKSVMELRASTNSNDTEVNARFSLIVVRDADG